MVKNKQKIRAKDILGKRTLILGEASSGKTKLAAKLLRELINIVDPRKIAVIDLAPEKIGDLGGRLTDYVNLTVEIKYLAPEKVYMPRLTGTSPEEILHYAELNRKKMEPLLNGFIQNPTETLIINDITLYLHLGELKTVLECARLARTFLATAYHGSRLADDLGTGITSRERQLTEELAILMDLVVETS